MWHEWVSIGWKFQEVYEHPPEPFPVSVRCVHGNSQDSTHFMPWNGHEDNLILTSGCALSDATILQ